MADKPSARKSGGASGARKSSSSSRSGSGSGSASGSRSNGRGGMSALDAAQAARKQLTALLGRPVEAVLGVDRENGDWVVKAQVVELSRIPNTTDVLGEYEAVLDRRGEIVRYSRTHRYHRGQVDAQR